MLELVLDKHGGPDWRSENCEPLVCGGQVGVADPDVGPQRGDVWWCGTGGIPHSGLTLVEVDAGMVMKVGRQEVIDWADSLWCDGDINVVQESHEVFVRC